MNAPPRKEGGPGHGVRIIVADDHEWIRQILVEVTRQTLPAARIIETEDGLEALKVYRHGGCDFLITNHHMPHMSGMDLIRQVRKQTPDLPILMISVHPEAKVGVMAVGASCFLTMEQIMERMPPLLLKHAAVRVSAPT